MKKNIGAVNGLYPIPDVIVGTEVEGKTNFVNIAYVGIVDHDMISVSFAKGRYSGRGLMENKTFSINIIDEDMIVKADYVGIVSGEKVDKSGVFSVFHGELDGAPMIEESPLSMECELVDTKEMETHITYFGKIINTYCDNWVLNDENKLDFEKVGPVSYAENKYWLVGEPTADCWSIGNEYKQSENK